MSMRENSLNSSLLPDENESTNCFSKRRAVAFIIAGTTLVCFGIVIFFLFFDKRPENPNLDECAKVSDSDKFDCFPVAPVTESECLKKGCCYHAQNPKGSSQLGIPTCFYPSNYIGYKVNNVTWSSTGGKASLTRSKPSGFPKDVKNLDLVVTFIDDNSLRIKITDSDSDRYEVSIPLHYTVKKRKSPQYEVNITMDGVLSISRKSSGISVFNTSLSRLIFADQYLEVASRLPSPYIYGIGEHMDGMLKNVNWTKFTLFNFDNKQPFPNLNLYGSHPFYLAMEENGSANGAFLYNSNAMDVILQPSPAITFRTIGGVLDLFFMMGPSPDQVIQQYTNIVGQTFMPPYWSLGFQLCKYGYNSLNRTREVWQQVVDAGIPFDVQWNDIDYMERHNDFTYDKVQFSGLPEFVEELHQKGMHYVIMVDPGISNSENPGTYPPYDEGVKNDIFVKNSTGQIFTGKVWNDANTVFPDFSHPNIRTYWGNQFRRFYNEVAFDGAWIDMNEPSNFYDGQNNGCPNSTLEDPPYVPGYGSPLRHNTLCMTAKHHQTTHYNEHNIYGYREAVETNYALRSIRNNKRPFIISRATFLGQGLHSGHWSGDIASSWKDMRYTIASTLNFNMYGMSMIGSDICGFHENTTVELCARWQALGAFYPFSRNHNDIDTIEQDPVSLGPIVVEATRNSLLTRYYLLPYLYTLFYRSHIYGETLARPLFYEFPNDVYTYELDSQFLWGAAFMIIPALYPDIKYVSAYFPEGLWYDFHTGADIKSGPGQIFVLPSNLTTINLAVRGGYILPLQQPAVTTTASRQNDFELLVALNDQKEAIGELYWDDGDSLDTYEEKKYNLIKFRAKANFMNTTIENFGYRTKMDLSGIKMYGVTVPPTNVTINGKEASFVYHQNNLVINATDFSLLKPLSVNWQ